MKIITMYMYVADIFVHVQAHFMTHACTRMLQHTHMTHTNITGLNWTIGFKPMF